MSAEKQAAALTAVQELEFAALELNLYLDTHPTDLEAVSDFNKAVEGLDKYVRKYEAEYGPLRNFGFSYNAGDKWRWLEGPWPWEL